MKDPYIVTKEEMQGISALLMYTSPENAPLSFVYGNRTVSGIPAEFSPKVTQSTEGTVKTTVICGTDPAGLTIRAEYKEYTDFPVTEWVFYFTNHGVCDTPILSDIGLCGTLAGDEAVLWHGNGDTCGRDGYHWEDTPITAPICLHTSDGTSCNGAFPYMRLRTRNGGYNMAFGWSGSWEASFSPSENGTKLTLGQWRCHMKIRPGETMRTPSLTLMGYCGDDARARNLWRRWYFAHILPCPKIPRLCLHTFWIDGKEEFCGATEQNQINSIETYVRRGLRPDIWWIDAGWYSCDYSWWKVGDWNPNPENFPRGLGPVGEACDKHGISLLLWFEPERCHSSGRLLSEHPEFFLHLQDNSDQPYDSSSLNMGDSAARTWMTDRVDALIKESHIRVYRQDFNYKPMGFWAQHEESDRIGAMENLHIQGYLQYWDDLLSRNPGLWIDNCASGGRRNDIDAMRRSVPLHYTDVGYGEHPIKQLQHRQMFEWIPYFRAHTMSHDDSDGNYNTGGHQPIDAFCYHNAMVPAMTSMIEYNDSDELFDLGIKMDKIWRRAAALELYGDYYPLTQCRMDPHDDYAMQFEDPATGEGFVQMIRNTKVSGDAFTVIPYAERGYTYTFTDAESAEEFTRTGEELLRCGITATLPRRSAVLYFYQKKAD